MQTKSLKNLGEFNTLEDIVSYSEVKDLLNKRVSSNEQLSLFVKHNNSSRYIKFNNLEFFSILDFFNSYKGLFLLGRYIKFYVNNSEIYGFSFYIEEQVLQSHRVTFGAIYLGDGDTPKKMKEEIIEDISYVLNKTGYLSIVTTEKDKFLSVYKSICDTAKCGKYLETEDYVILWMGHTTFNDFKLLYNKENMTERDWVELKIKILEET